MKKSLVLALAAAAGVLAAGAAHAGGNVYWSIGVNTPPVATVISNAPGYYAPAPVYYPPPVVYTPAPRMYYPQPAYVYERPERVYHHGYRRDRDRDGIPDRYDRYDNRQGWHGHHRDNYRETYRDRDRDGIPDRRDPVDNRRYGY